MISPSDIKQQALKWWKAFLQNEVNGSGFFPKQIDRIGKVNPAHLTNRFGELQSEIENLYRHSKNQTGAGYLVKSASRSFRRTGTHELPESIVFETAEDYISFIDKRKEWKVFIKNCTTIRESLPTLSGWIYNNVDLLSIERPWENILKVCYYFIANPRPALYIRQLPVAIHTKFIEENEFILRSLLDYLIPEDIRDAGAINFSKRYYLKTDEPLIRIRMLDRRYAFQGITDISVRISEFSALSMNCQHVLITENKMNFLALPDLKNTIAIWSGGGFNVSYLKGVEWLKKLQILYWGDLDIQGFQILHQVRGYYPQTKSVMMDKVTFDLFKTGVSEGQPGNVLQLGFLTTSEMEMFDLLKDSNLRLEQEKIPQWYVDEILGRLSAQEGAAA